MIENLIISPETEAGKMVLANKLNQIIDTINDQEERGDRLEKELSDTMVGYKELDKNINFIMQNSRFTEPPKFISKKRLKELYKDN